jgi:YD repeat-containing protein
MHARHRTGLVLALCVALVAPLTGDLAASEVRATRSSGATAGTPSLRSHAGTRGLTGSRATVVAAAAPVRVAVTEPPRVASVPLPASAVRPKVMAGVPAANPVRVPGLPMLRPSQIDAVIKAARARNALPAKPAPTPTAAPQRSTAGAVSSLGAAAPPGAGTGSSGASTSGASSPPARSAAATTRSGARATQSLADGTPGTGINPWWRYQEEALPGGERVMVNVGTGNVLLQGDDMLVPHKGLAMAFRRTYNAQSGHDVNASDAAGWYWKPPGMYGNGWTNTFDAHLVRTPDGTHWSVFDIDGARYDFTATSGVAAYSPVPGNRTTLTYDNACGLLWTKKSGTTYYFYRPNPNIACPGFAPNGGLTGGFAGRLYQIIGRNRNTYLTFTYSWDGGDASANGKISAISVQAESGLTTTLTFGDVNGHRLLSQLTYPDGTTSVLYQYDGDGNLTSVLEPANNAAGTRPQHGYGFVPLGTGFILQWTSSPLWSAACSAGVCGSGGGYAGFNFTGTDVASSLVTKVQSFGVVNPTLADGGPAGPLQPGVAGGAIAYRTDYYSTGVATPTLRDDDGHMTNWVVDTQGRPTQTQECTQSINHGQTCTGQWLTTNEAWDTTNDLTSETDARGNQTDYVYDVDGNTVAVAAPPPTAGAARPTRLFSYDAHDNVTAYCDPNSAPSQSAATTFPPTAPAPGQGGLCPQSSVATQYQWTTSTAEPFGELTATITPGTAAAPGGYQREFSYDVGPQGGSVDYGLPTRVLGASIAQSNDPATPTRQPQQTFWYDANGNLLCYGSGAGQWILTYDSLGRLRTASDPDDAATVSSTCTKSGAQTGWNTTAHTDYFPNGAVKSKQSASQYTSGVAATFTYDLDGNVQTETHHHGCTSTASCTPGMTTKWYDGADRLVEVQQPYDSTDIQAYPWSTRYIYDLSQGGTTTYRGRGLAGYGNLVSTQELLSGTVWEPAFNQYYSIATASWTDVRATSFDALDRPVSSYEAAFGDQPKITNSYDGPGAAGLLSSVQLATNELKSFVYDNLGRRTDVAYPNDPSGTVTPAVHEAYDADGRVTSRTTSALGTETLAYDATGAVTSVTEPASVGGGTIAYTYYADGMRAAAGYSDPTQSYPNALQYAYRTDGKRDVLTLRNGTSFAWSYTAAGRVLSQSDPLTGTAVAPDAYYTNSKGLQIPYYPNSITYAPWRQTFDTFGRVQSITFPVSLFSYSGSQFDLEDGIAQQTDSGYRPAGYTSRYGTQNLCLLTTVRGEKTVRGQAGSPCSLSGPPNEINGTQMTDQNGRLLSAQNWTLDGRSGMLLHRTSAAPNGTDTAGSSYAYDASGRLTQDFEGEGGPRGATPPTYSPAWCLGANTANVTYCYSNGSRAKTYDAENRLHGETFTMLGQTASSSGGLYYYGSYWRDTSGYGQPANIVSVDYGTTSHPMRFALYHSDLAGSPQSPSETRAWLWDGDDRFIACSLVNGQCQNPSLSIEGLGDYSLAGNAISSVNDRNRYGLASMTHGPAMFSGWVDKPASAGRWALMVPCSSGSVDPPDTSDPVPPCPAQHDGKLTADGWSLDYETWQGVRTSDLAIGQWNTPDAYAGEVHDPMSQKPFMWNRNNPYAYADPSGYDPRRLDEAIAASVLVGGIERGIARGIAEKALSQNVRRAALQEARVNGRTLERTSGTDGPKTSINYPNGGSGLPDRLTRSTIEEAKAGKYQALTRQLRGQQDYAQDNELEHILHTYDDIRLSKPLEDLINSGRITQKTYPRPQTPVRQ